MKAISFAVLALLLPMTAAAQNRGPLLMGGRTSGMGGAGIAFGDDSAMGFINPAGLARTPKDVLSLSASAYSYDLYRYDDFFAQQPPPDLVGLDVTVRSNELRSSSVSALPASLTYMTHLGEAANHVLGFSVLVPRAERRRLDGVLRLDSAFVTSNASFSTARDDTSYYVGPSYAVAIGDRETSLMIGASAFMVYTTRSVLTEYETLVGAVPATDFFIQKVGAFTTASSYDLVAVLGAQLKLDIFSLGLVVHSPSAHLGGRYEQNASSTTAANGTFDAPNTVVEIASRGAFEERQPLRLGLGAALELERFTIGADVRLLLPMGSYNRFEGASDISQLQAGAQPSNSTEPQVVPHQERIVLNAAVGLEVRLTQMWTLRAGGFTSFSSSDLSQVETEPLSSEQLHRFGGTLGLGVQLGDVETSVNFVYTGGQGDVIGLDNGNSANPSGQRITTALQSSFSLLISGSVNLESLLAGS